MDKIILVDNGTVREVGSRFELMNKRGRYWEVKVKM